MSEGERRGWPLVTEIVEGDPIQVEGGELVPIVRMTRYGRRRALIADEQIAGQGRHFVSLRPVAILDERRPEGQRVIICDETERAIKQLLLVALMVPLVAALLIYVWRRLL